MNGVTVCNECNSVGDFDGQVCPDCIHDMYFDEVKS